MDLYYQYIISSSPKLVDIAKILRKYRVKPAVIMISFLEMTLITEKVSRYLPLTPMRMQQYLMKFNAFPLIIID